jgi:hypothetical protein
MKQWLAGVDYPENVGKISQGKSTQVLIFQSGNTHGKLIHRLLRDYQG